MKKSISNLVCVLGYIFTGLLVNLFAQPVAASALLERDGQYEINWTTGKIRFYGVGKADASEDSLRPAEQRAWADGLRLAERNIPILMSGRMGGAEKTNAERIAKLSVDTTSVTTTYFGDMRVKVILETAIHKMAPHLLAPVPTTAELQSSGVGLVIKLPKGVKAAAFVSILDEHGREMLSTKSGVAAAQAGSPLVKWFKSEAGPVDGLVLAQAPVISGTSTERGIIRVNSSEWKSDYAGAVARGAAAIVIQ
jgi:hypothetical protein